MNTNLMFVVYIMPTVIESISGIYKNKIFTSFFSTKGGVGTGLGLLVTQKIIKEHGGTISVKSETGKGSTFAIRLPLRENV